MPKISNEPVHRLHIVLFREEYKKIKALAERSNQSVSQLYRALTQTLIKHSEDEIRRQLDELEKQALSPSSSQLPVSQLSVSD